MTMTGSRTDAIELLTSHHREMDQLWSQVQASHGQQSDAQNDQARALIRLISQHDAIETQLLYPELRESAGEQGKEKSKHSLDEHQQVRELLKQVDDQDVRDEARFRILSQAMSEVQHHAKEEEGEVFPLLRKHVDGPRLMELGEKMAAMMDKAPTHPHPMTPNSKAGATLAGAVTGAIDRAKDKLKGQG